MVEHTQYSVRTREMRAAHVQDDSALVRLTFSRYLLVKSLLKASSLMAKRCDLFLPEPGCMLAALDYSSIEMYGLAHFAIGERSEVIKEQARQHADFHTMAQILAELEERIWAKRLNFTVVYGAGPKGIFLKNKKAFKTLEKTIEVYNKFHAGMPYIRQTQKHVANEVRLKGYILSIGGRAHHKPKPFFDPEKGRWNDGLYKMLKFS